MRLVISIIMAALVGFLGYLIYQSIQEPIAFAAEKTKRADAVAAKLTNIRTLQDMYRTIKGGYAPTFEELISTIKNDSIPFVNIIGDPDDPNFTGEIQRVTTYTSAMDSVTNMGISLDGIDIVPYSNNTKFTIQTDTIEYQSTQVNVIEVGTRWKEFMGEFSDPKYKKYDNRYDPNAAFKFGDLSAPSLNGTW